MNIVSINDVSKNVKETPLFTGVSFGIDEGEHIGFVGANGCGKSTFLHLLTGDLSADSGSIALGRDLTVDILEQRPAFDADTTVKSFLYAGRAPLLKLAAEYDQCLHEVSSSKTENKGLQQKLTKLTQQMEEQNGFALEHTYESLLSELGMSNCLEAKMSTMSGGMIKKVALARVFTASPKLLLLDEPTNHLDIETIEWLEKKLLAYAGTFILVTHDRWFLDSVCNIMMDIDRCKINKYEGNFSTYLRRKKERAEEEARHDARREAILTVELEWLKRGPKARALKDSHRKARIQALLNERHEQQAQMEEFSAVSHRLGGKILNLKNISKTWENGKNVINPFSYEFTKGERIGIIGPNGSGKSTFLDMIAGKTGISSGEADYGVNTIFGYFDQTAKFVDRELTVLEYMRNIAHHVKLKDGTMCSIEQFLEKFLFPQEMFNQKLSYLSGGELRRLQLIQILAAAPNFLLFDEPTNDFDIQTISILEDFLNDFDGCILAVSHDRAFLDSVTDFLFVFDGNGNISYFAGGYADYRAYLTEKESAASSKEKKPESDKDKKSSAPQKEEKKRLTFKEKQEFDGLLDVISALEEEKAELEAFFSSPEAASSGASIGEKQKRYETVIGLIQEKTKRWEYLAEFSV